MHVPRQQPEPIGGGEVADGVADMAVQHELRLGRGAGGEIEQHRIGRVRRRIRLEVGRGGQQRIVGVPAGHRRAHRDADDRGIPGVEFRRVLARRDNVAHPATGDTLGEVAGGEQRRGRADHGAELHRRQHRLPQRDHVAEHQQDAVAALHAERPQAVGHPVGTFGQLGERQAGSPVADDLQRQARAAFALGQLGVEPVQREIEILQLRPTKSRIGRTVVGAVCDQEIARGLEFPAAVFVRAHAAFPCY